MAGRLCARGFLTIAAKHVMQQQGFAQFVSASYIIKAAQLGSSM
jgi:hypothetical protein